MNAKQRTFCRVVENAIYYSNMHPDAYITVMVDSMQNSQYFASNMPRYKERMVYAINKGGTRQFLMCIVGGLRYE